MKSFAVLALALALLAGSAEAETSCALNRLASVDIVIADQGVVTGAAIGDTKLAFLFDTRLPHSVLFEGTTKQLGLPDSSAGDAYVDIDAHPLYYASRIPSLRVGPMAYPPMSFLVAQRALNVNGQAVAGVLGVELLRYSDMEIDPKLGKLNFYSQDHCEGKVVYWAKEYFASPLHLRNNGQLEIDVELDGEPLHAVLSTGMGDSLLQVKAAGKRFGLDEHSPGMIPADPVTDLSNFPIATFRYPFKTLKFGELTIHDPQIRVAETGTQPVVHTHLNPDATADLLIGMNFLKKFHLYIATREDKLYYTIAE